MTHRPRAVPTLLLAALALALAGFAAQRQQQQPDVPEFAKRLPEFKSGDPAFAFNGKNLDGWYTYLRDNKYEDPHKVFSVRDGMLHISGQEFGGVTTKQTFRDYHLVAEWRWGERTWELLEPKTLARPKGSSRDAGILLHCVGEDGASYGHWMESIEVQIIEGGVGDFLVLGGKHGASLTAETAAPNPPGSKQLYFQPGGTPVTLRRGRVNWWGRDPDWTDTLGYRGPREVEAPHGQWNRLEVICDGPTITTILNGVLVNRGTEARPAEGKIQLQSEGAEIVFRKVEVRPLVK